MTSSFPQDVQKRLKAPRPSSASHATSVLAATFASLALLAATALLVRTGSLHSPEFGGLLFGPGARFSDLTDVVSASASRMPYGAASTNTAGPAYPPGLFGLTYALEHVSLSVARTIVGTLTVLALAALVGFVGMAAWSRGARVASAAVSAGAMCATLAVLDWYAVTAGIAAIIILVAILAQRVVPAAPRLVALPVAFGTSLPMIFALDRMNIDVIVFVLVVATLILYQRRRGGLAGVTFGAAIAIKIYPVYLAVADTRKVGRVKRLALAATAAISLTLFGVSTTAYSLRAAVDGFNRSLIYFEQNYIVASSGMPYGASLLTAIRIVYRESGRLDVNDFTARIYPAWKTGSAVAIIALAALTVIVNLPQWSRLVVMVTALMVLSPNTGMYRATLLLVAIAVWLHYLDESRLKRPITALEVCLAASLGAGIAPLTFAQIGGFEPTVNLTTQTLLAPLVYLVVGVVGFLAGLENRGHISSPPLRSSRRRQPDPLDSLS